MKFLKLNGLYLRTIHSTGGSGSKARAPTGLVSTESPVLGFVLDPMPSRRENADSNIKSP